MNRTNSSIEQPAAANNNSPRLADIAVRADHMARELAALAALAATPSQAAIVVQIARAALSRAFDARRVS
jgi:alkylhydroperoxidase/carboxymuconolactone decarboxylase family protein YurZ